MMKTRKLNHGLEDLPGGYVYGAFVGTDQPADADDLEDGFCAYPGLDLDDMFGAFERTANYGLAGGDRTVDDFTPEGLETQIGGASGSEGRVVHEPDSHRKISHAQKYP